MRRQPGVARLAGDLHGAFAYSPSTGVVGGSRNYPTKEGAQEHALGECTSHPLRPGDCKVIMTGPGPCFALATGPTLNLYSTGQGATIEEAQDMAMAHSHGKIFVSNCHDGEGPKSGNGVFGR